MAEAARNADPNPEAAAACCLPGDAEVFTDDGPKAIADVRARNHVWGLTREGAWTLQPIQRSGWAGYDQILTVRTSNRTLRLNERHHVLVRRAGEVPAPVVMMADGHRRSLGRATKVWTSVYVSAADLRVGDTLVTVNHLPAGGIDVAVSGRALMAGFLECCGLLMGDGNISRRKGEPVGVQIARGGQASYMDHYRAVMREAFDAASKGGVFDDARRRRVPIRLDEGTRQTRFSSVSAARELNRLGLGGTARTKRLPGWVFQSTEPLRLAFLRGFLDADGPVDKKGRISFSSCNRTMLSQVRHLCLSVGVPVTNLRCQRGQTRLPNGRTVPIAQATFTCSDPAENRRIGSHTPAYVTRMAEGQPFGRKGRRYPWHGGRGFKDGSLQLSRVCSIERSMIAERVYDLDVAGTHNFIADGVVVHSSNLKERP
jgi:LAGLIDADG-like domain